MREAEHLVEGGGDEATVDAARAGPRRRRRTRPRPTTRVVVHAEHERRGQRVGGADERAELEEAPVLAGHRGLGEALVRTAVRARRRQRGGRLRPRGPRPPQVSLGGRAAVAMSACDQLARSAAAAGAPASWGEASPRPARSAEPLGGVGADRRDSRPRPQPPIAPGRRRAARGRTGSVPLRALRSTTHHRSRSATGCRAEHEVDAHAAALVEVAGPVVPVRVQPVRRRASAGGRRRRGPRPRRRPTASRSGGVTCVSSPRRRRCPRRRGPRGRR